MNNKLGQYYNDEHDYRSNYSLNFFNTDGKQVNVSFRAEPEYDLDTIFAEIRNFLIATNHDIEGPIGELGIDEGSYEDEPQIHQDKFSMDHLPNNGWPFGGLTTADIAPLTVTDLTTNETYAYKDKYTIPVNQYPTMAPITQEQIQSWSFSSEGIQALTSADLSKWVVNAPGTIGGAKVTF
jgi:hypothetical protein